VRNAINVDTTRCDIGCNHHAVLSITKAIERILTLALREIPVQRCCIEAVLLKTLSKTLCGVLHLCEDHDKRLRISGKPRSEHRLLFGILNVVHRVRNRSYRSLALYAHNLRVTKDLTGERLNLIGHSCREEHGLSLCWHQLNDLLDVRKEAHVEHPIRFIQDEELNR
jgi:hypothetical protein